MDVRRVLEYYLASHPEVEARGLSCEDFLCEDKKAKAIPTAIGISNLHINIQNTYMTYDIQEQLWMELNA